MNPANARLATEAAERIAQAISLLKAMNPEDFEALTRAYIFTEKVGVLWCDLTDIQKILNSVKPN